MKSIIKIIIILILFLFQAGFSQSLKETVKIALEASPGIASAREQLRESKLDAKSTHRSTLPQLDFSASYQHVTDRASLNLLGGGPLPGMKVNLGVFDTYETGLMANYILFNKLAVCFFIQRAVNGRLFCVFVDNGLLRKNEFQLPPRGKVPSVRACTSGF